MQKLNKIFVSLSLFVCVIFPSYASAQDKPTPLVSLPTFHVEIKASEERFAREFIDLLSSTRRGQRNVRALRNLARLKSQTEYFTEFHQTIDRANTVFSGALNTQNFHQRCQNAVLLQTNPIARQLEQSLNTHCLREFIRIYQGRSLKEKEINFITTNLESLLSGQHLSNFSTLLEALEKESAEHIQISEAITDHLINRKVRPQGNLVRSMHVNQRLTTYLQEVGHSDDTSHRFFTNEFNLLVENTRQLAQNESPKEAIVLFDQAHNFYVQNQQYISENLAARNFLFVGQDFIRSGKHEKAKYVFGTSVNSFLDGHQEEFTFQLLWSDIIQDNYQSAEKNLYQLDILANIDKFGDRIHYWAGKILEKRNKNTPAIELYQGIIQRSPVSYYAILSTKDLSRIAPDRPEIKRFIASSISAPHKYITLEATDYAPHFRRALGRIGIWGKLEMGHWIYDETHHLLNTDVREHVVNEGFVQSAPNDLIKRQMIRDFAEVFNFHGEYLQTFRLINNSIRQGIYSIADTDLSQLFPMSYLQDIKRTDPTVDPIIILSLIRQESAFNPKAISSAGARGLMQLMPNTARMLHGRLRANQLEDTSLNLSLGIQYFNKRLKQYEGDLIFTLASYNAGAHRVNRWQSEVFQNQDPLKIIETIPYRETRNYVKLIYRNMFFYRLINEDIDLDQSVADSFKVSLRH